MSSATWPVYSPFAREHYGRGKNDGRVEGEAQAVLKVLAARRIEVPDEARARIRACTDLQQLDAWLERATVVTTIAALFE